MQLHKGYKEHKEKHAGRKKNPASLTEPDSAAP
jgi:hypothetical protein